MDIVSGVGQVEELVCRVLALALELGAVYIITAASMGWVEATCKTFFPRLATMLHRGGIPICSAREWHAQHHGGLGGPSQWKKAAFFQLMKETFDTYVAQHGQPHNIPYSLVSIGDSQHEHEACRTLASSVVNNHGKTVKFIDRPTLEEVYYQLESMLCTLPQICNQTGHLDLQLCRNSSSKSFIVTQR